MIMIVTNAMAAAITEQEREGRLVADRGTRDIKWTHCHVGWVKLKLKFVSAIAEGFSTNVFISFSVSTSKLNSRYDFTQKPWNIVATSFTLFTNNTIG